ncbi:putative sulfate exporter family transporter [Vibrio sp. SM6]|uniref:Putative sulfate exporter family transporter n=1 Tax=Vibrio agarilyticus TaxID=2726741 RepID=A0A7X8TS41_9VIBR|nr:putative sulfate exporter family transporter [Vibrio agarilyticus]NLS13865.1 putative sulfate exporter family transporter [Vibrio agarilyticus]
MTPLIRNALFAGAFVLCLTPWITSPMALILGFTLATFNALPIQIKPAAITKKLLAYSIIGLGFGISLDEAIAVTQQGIGLILATIIGTLALGYLIGRLLKLEKKTAHLIASGTAICGGSAIAAVAPAIKADDEQIALALATVFVLNSIALFLFPALGHAFELDQHTFGTWAAIAIHDTSSVVGAASAYGEEALTTATTLKLARALWIVPIALFSAMLFKSHSQKVAIPYFIGFYCLAVVFADLVPQGQAVYEIIFAIAKQALVVCLFLIGCSLSIAKLKAAGTQPMLLGVSLWIAISVSSLTWLLATR